jgi:hypothetical protein
MLAALRNTRIEEQEKSRPFPEKESVNPTDNRRSPLPYINDLSMKRDG